VLVVEDNADLRQFLENLLSPHYRVSFAEDGAQGLDAARSERPDLILSDVMMPILSGYDMARQLKDDPRTRDIPIVLLTAKRGLDPKLEGFAHGADDYLGKPFSTRELLARVRVQLRLRELSRRLSEVEKTRMLETLSAGLAHEVRNPINAIINAVPVVRKLVPTSGGQTELDITELLDVIEQGSRRIDSMVEDLLTFTNQDRAEVKQWDPNESLESTLKLLGAAGKVSTVVRELEFRGTVEGRPAALNTLVMNLLDNALRAAGPRGTITLRSRATDRGMHLEVSDDGPGIAADVLPRIFDPYFTTRDVGVGTGLGLHLSRQIVEGHQGKITARSEPGQGATFLVDLPRLPFGELHPPDTNARVTANATPR
jgi:signal transduction histidine kinase